MSRDWRRRISLSGEGIPVVRQQRHPRPRVVAQAALGQRAAQVGPHQRVNYQPDLPGAKRAGKAGSLGQRPVLFLAVAERPNQYLSNQPCVSVGEQHRGPGLLDAVHGALGDGQREVKGGPSAAHEAGVGGQLGQLVETMECADGAWNR
jgi:hypothetical protein